MLFRSRRPLTLSERAKLLVWPRRSYARSATYCAKRLVRLKASPHKIGIGVAIGVFASITPLVGMQMVMAGALAYILRGSLTAAMLATWIGNPLSWPLIWGVTYAVGRFMVGHPGSAEAAALPHSAEGLWPFIYPMLIGSIPVGLASAAVSYGLVARTVEVMRGNGSGGSTFEAWLREAIRPAWRLW